MTHSPAVSWFRSGVFRARLLTPIIYSPVAPVTLVVVVTAPTSVDVFISV